MIEPLDDMPEGTLGFRVAGEFKVFPVSELEQAKRWVAGQA